MPLSKRHERTQKVRHTKALIEGQRPRNAPFNSRKPSHQITNPIFLSFYKLVRMTRARATFKPHFTLIGSLSFVVESILLLLLLDCFVAYLHEKGQLREEHRDSALVVLFTFLFGGITSGFLLPVFSRNKAFGRRPALMP